MTPLPVLFIKVVSAINNDALSELALKSTQLPSYPWLLLKLIPLISSYPDSY